MSVDSDKHAQVLVIGAGPAGYTAAIYASRANLAPIVLAGPEPGGQLMTTTDVENFPGYPKGVTGPDMMDELREQAERFGSRVEYDIVESVDLSSRPFKVVAEGDEVYTADAIVIATGASARYLGIESEQRLRNKGVTACATCDGAFYADMEVAVVGGGDTAMEEATFLTRMCSKVHLIHRREEFRASKIMLRRAMDNPKIQIHTNKVVDEVLGADRVEGVRIKDVNSGETSELAIRGFFLAIGHVPNGGIFGDQLDKDSEGYLKVAPGTTRTNVEGVFACGDIADKTYRQAITAAGTGCMAAMDAERWLAEQE